jgi:hypothetical protein
MQPAVANSPTLSQGRHCWSAANDSNRPHHRRGPGHHDLSEPADAAETGAGVHPVGEPGAAIRRLQRDGDGELQAPLHRPAATEPRPIPVGDLGGPLEPATQDLARATPPMPTPVGLAPTCSACTIAVSHSGRFSAQAEARLAATATSWSSGECPARPNRCDSSVRTPRRRRSGWRCPPRTCRCRRPRRRTRATGAWCS